MLLMLFTKTTNAIPRRGGCCSRMCGRATMGTLLAPITNVRRLEWPGMRSEHHRQGGARRTHGYWILTSTEGKCVAGITDSEELVPSERLPTPHLVQVFGVLPTVAALCGSVFKPRALNPKPSVEPTKLPL